MTAVPPELARASAQSLTQAIAKNEEATNAVQDVADELVVVHAVLSQEVGKIAGNSDASDAVERTAALEKKLTETAEKMLEVNEALAEQHASLEHLHNAK